MRFEPLLDPELSSHLFKEILIKKGTWSARWRARPLSSRGTSRTGHQEHVYIEPNGLIAVPQDDGHHDLRLDSGPFYVHKALVTLLGSAVRHVRVVQTEQGGGFGGKEEYPSMIAGHAALLALKAQPRQKLIYDREGGHARDDKAASVHRAASHGCHARRAHRRNGRRCVAGRGGVRTAEPRRFYRAARIHAAFPYRCADKRAFTRVRDVMTNTPPNGASAASEPQTQFAREVHLDRVAEALGMDPVRLRQRNALRPGDMTATRPDTRCRLQRATGAAHCGAQVQFTGASGLRTKARTAASEWRFSITARVSREAESSGSRRARRWSSPRRACAS